MRRWRRLPGRGRLGRASRRRALAVIAGLAIAIATACRSPSGTAGRGAPSSSTGAGDRPATTARVASTGPPGTSAPASISEPSRGAGPAPTLAMSVLARYPHDRGAFTEGLVLADGLLYESTGLNGSSTLRAVGPTTGQVTRSVRLANEYFGEGLALVDDRFIQLTWRNGVALVYRRADLASQGTMTYEGEGWGLCDDGRRLVMSDGSATLTFRDRHTFAVTGHIAVHDGGRPVERLNELECVGDAVYANVWLTDRIARIDPASGTVTAWLDAASLVPEGAGTDDVLNGIAYDPADGTLLLTGKRWPWLYRVRVD